MLNGVKQYVQDQIALVKLDSIEIAGKIASKLVLFGLIAILGLFLLLIGSLTIAWFLADALGAGYGFLIVAGIYLLLILILFFLRKQIQSAIVNTIIGAAMNKDVDKLKERN